MESSAVKNSDGTDADDWVSQTILGEQFGWTSKDTGHCLRLMGLRVKAMPTVDAEERGLARTEPRQDAKGAAYLHTLWHHDKVSALISQYANKQGGFANLTAHLQLKRNQPTSGVEAVLQLIGQPKIVADANPDHVQKLFSLIAGLDERVRALESRRTTAGHEGEL